jgi:CheY-like chemotaxis protein
LSLLGVKSVAAARSSARAADILIFDADNCARELEAARAASKGPLVIIASAAAIEGQHLEERVPSEHLVRKPVHRDALREAIEAALASASSGFKSRTPALTRATSRGHVLIVEDEAINAAVAQGYLAELGYSSVWVANGAAAIARKSVEHFDLILMDLNMPGLDGYATASLIRRSERIGEHIPIVALTANHASDYRDSCVKAGMDDILGKPYTVDQCAALLSRWVQQKSGPSSGHDAARNPANTASGVDTATVRSLRDIPGSGRVDLYARIVAIFRQSSVQALSQISAALAAEDLATARAIAHKIKGGAASVGALEFSNLLGELEQACRAGDAARAQSLYVTLTAAHPKLVAELAESTARASA